MTLNTMGTLLGAHPTRVFVVGAKSGFCAYSETPGRDGCWKFGI